MIATGTDPRLAPPPGDVRPVVARIGRTLPGWLLAAAALFLALLMFVMLETHRQSRIAPTTRVRSSDLARLPTAPPPLFVPPDARPAPPPTLPVATTPPPAIPTPMPTQPPPSVRSAPTPPTTIQMLPSPTMTPIPRQGSNGPALVIDTTVGSPEPSAQQRQIGNVMVGPMTDPSAPGASGSRSRAGTLVNRATTVPQGTLIPAVLETALDSTRPGQVRALVSRDVRGFDGSQVLIPRGSRLFGEYRADLRPGQKRAFVQWTRLVRPDGVSMALQSPAADPLGRAGIRGKVDSHFFERFGSAILQTTLDIGTAIGTQQLAGGSNVVLVPGVAQAFRPNVQLPIQPTLTVRQGARVTVFVANDLDFTGVGTPPK